MRYIIFGIVTLVFLVCLGYGIMYSGYLYNVHVGQYLSLSDDASIAQTKLDYMMKYKDSIISDISRNDARYVFKQERLTRDKQIQIIDTLIQRLNETSRMNPESFEYQQAMSQISGQEYDHTLSEINSIIHSCWIRDNAFVIVSLWFGWLIWLVITCFCINWETVADELF